MDQGCAARWGAWVCQELVREHEHAGDAEREDGDCQQRVRPEPRNAAIRSADDADRVDGTQRHAERGKPAIEPAGRWEHRRARDQVGHQEQADPWKGRLEDARNRESAGAARRWDLDRGTGRVVQQRSPDWGFG
jgi:hypothetical protein